MIHNQGPRMNDTWVSDYLLHAPGQKTLLSFKPQLRVISAKDGVGGTQFLYVVKAGIYNIM